MAFNLVFPCEVDISGTAITKIMPDGSMTLNDATSQAGINTTSLTYTDVATEYEKAHYNDVEIGLYDAGNQTTVIDNYHMSITTAFGPSINLDNTTNKTVISSGSIASALSDDSAQLWSLDQNALSINAPDNTTNVVLAQGSLTFNNLTDNFAPLQITNDTIHFNDNTTHNTAMNILKNERTIEMYDTNQEHFVSLNLDHLNFNTAVDGGGSATTGSYTNTGSTVRSVDASLYTVITPNQVQLINGANPATISVDGDGKTQISGAVVAESIQATVGIQVGSGTTSVSNGISFSEGGEIQTDGSTLSFNHFDMTQPTAPTPSSYFPVLVFKDGTPNQYYIPLYRNA
jgi:hypothetical protein